MAISFCIESLHYHYQHIMNSHEIHICLAIKHLVPCALTLSWPVCMGVAFKHRVPLYSLTQLASWGLDLQTPTFANCDP
jgi:hypothetical protein